MDIYTPSNSSGSISLTATQELSRIKIAIVSNSVHQRKHLKEALRDAGLNVVMNEPLGESFISKMDKFDLDVVLLDLDENEIDEDIFEALLANDDVPIIFNDVSVLTLNEPQVLARWYGKLLQKISESVGQMEDHVDSFTSYYEHSINSRQSSIPSIAESNSILATNVWVLGASLGGPDAIKEFFLHLPAGLPVAFILAQHLGANFISILAEQLNQLSEYEVLTPSVGHVLCHQQVVVTPVNERMTVNPIGALELNPIKEEFPYSPSIDLVLKDMADRYGKQCGAIIFSGMGDDGVEGCKYLHSKGGMVWVQDSESCVISSMPDNVVRTGVVSASGTPKKIAQNLFDYISNE